MSTSTGKMDTSGTEWTVEEALKSIGFDASSPLALGQLAGRLKLVKRAGWKRFGIESVVSAMTTAPH
jgi:hypothetical protein